MGLKGGLQGFIEWPLSSMIDKGRNGPEKMFWLERYIVMPVMG